MTGAVIEVSVQDAKARAVLAQLLAAGVDMHGFMADLGDGLLLSIDQRFETGKGPGGLPWKPSQRALDGQGQTLVHSGRLRQSFTRVATADSVEVGTNVVYAAVHQFGDVIVQHPYTRLNVQFTTLESGMRRFVKKGTKGASTQHSTFGERRITMPPRPFLGIDAEDEAMILDRGREWLATIAGQAVAA